MKILYISAWRPTMNDTFVIREIMELAQNGNEVVICVLKNVSSRNAGLNASNINEKNVSIVTFNFNIFQILTGFFWLLFTKPKKFFICFKELVKSCLCQISKAHHFIFIFFAAVFFSREKSVRDGKYIHAHFLHSGAVAARWLGQFVECPYGITSHIAKIRYKKSLMSQVIKGASILIGDTEETINFMESISGKRGILIRNGITLENFEYQSPKEYSNGSDVFNILACGTLIPPKGFDVLIEACKILEKNNFNFHCKIVGDGSERERLEKLGEFLIKGGLLEMPGALPIDQLLIEYKKADVLVVPSMPSKFGRDGLPTVIIEAMALGVPVIATNYAAIPEIVLNNKTGLLVPPLNPKSLAEAIIRYKNDYSLRARISQEARKKVEAEYDLRKNIELFLRMIFEATNTKSEVI
jgi:glycosyltransferase involved in cell wall biosynthesis